MWWEIINDSNGHAIFSNYDVIPMPMWIMTLFHHYVCVFRHKLPLPFNIIVVYSFWRKMFIKVHVDPLSFFFFSLLVCYFPEVLEGVCLGVKPFPRKEVFPFSFVF